MEVPTVDADVNLKVVGVQVSRYRVLARTRFDFFEVLFRLGNAESRETFFMSTAMLEFVGRLKRIFLSYFATDIGGVMVPEPSDVTTTFVPYFPTVDAGLLMISRDHLRPSASDRSDVGVGAGRGRAPPKVRPVAEREHGDYGRQIDCPSASPRELSRVHRRISFGGGAGAQGSQQLHPQA